jgi:hypothetical protein
LSGLTASTAAALRTCLTGSSSEKKKKKNNFNFSGAKLFEFWRRQQHWPDTREEEVNIGFEGGGG